MCARQEKAKRQARSSSQALWFAPSLMVRPVVLHAECPLFPQFSVNSCLVQKRKRPCMRSQRGLGYCAHFFLCIPCSLFKRQQKATPQGCSFGLHLGSPSTPRRKARARTHTQHSVLKTLRLKQRNSNTQNSFDVP